MSRLDSDLRLQSFRLFFLVAISFVLWWQPLTSTLKLALLSDAHTHILLIVPLSVALIYVDRKATPIVLGDRGWVGVILLGAALLLRGITAWNAGHLSPGITLSLNLSLNMFSVVVWWIGCVTICFGVQAFQSLLFPLCFLFLIVPLPEHALNWIVAFLQRQSAIAAELLFRIARVPVTRDGIVLSIPGLDIEVAHECSSIRSSTMLIIIALVLTHLFLRRWWRQVLLVVTAIPLSVAKNAVRIFTIAELGTRVNPGYLDGRLHHNGGIVFLSLAVVIMIILLWTLRRGELQSRPAG